MLSCPHYIFKIIFSYHIGYQLYILFFINYSSLIQSRSFQYFFLVKSTIKDLYLHGMTAYDASAKIKNTPVSDVEFHSGRMEVHIHTHKNEHNVCMACTYIRFATKRFYMYPQTFPTLWLRVFFPCVLSPQAFGVNSIALGDNSKAYGDNSKGYGDRIHPYKKV